MVGLAIMLALVFGVATTALGANGNPFLLGKGNLATALTKLTGNVNGSAMQVVNSNAGADDTALSLNVQTGEAPMRVNSDTRVANLNAASAGRADSAARADTATDAQNANTLDNKDSTEFLGKTETAADSEKLDGMDSDAFAGASHDHDNRYSPKLFAAIRGKDATPIRSSNLLAAFKYLGFAGSYEVVFDRDVSSCVYSATLINETAGRGSEAPNGQIGVRPLYTSARGVAVTTYDASGARADRDFSIVVHC